MIMRRIYMTLACILLLSSGGCGTDNSPPTLSGSNPSSTGSASVATTGQGTCYNQDGFLIDCASTGQDGELQKGTAPPSIRYTDNLNGTFTDNFTGLMWMTNPRCIEQIHPGFDNDGTPGDGLVTWQHGLDFATAVNSGTYDCGLTTIYTDWRLPNEREIESTTDFITSFPGYKTFLTTFKHYKKLTSTSVLNPVWAETYVWILEGDRQMSFSEKSSTDGGVWLVRTASGRIAASSPVITTGQTSCYDTAGTLIACTGTGQDGDLQTGVPLPSPRFIDNGDGAVIDALTGLMWMKEANCLGNLLPHLDTDGFNGDGQISWQHGLDFVAGLNYGAHNCGNDGDYTDWRLPNIKELRSLTSSQFSNPAISNSIGDNKWSNDDPFNGIPGSGIIIITPEPQPAAKFWSSTSEIRSSLFSGTPGTSAMVLEFSFGSTITTPKTELRYIWPVRGGN